MCPANGQPSTHTKSHSAISASPGNLPRNEARSAGAVRLPRGPIGDASGSCGRADAPAARTLNEMQLARAERLWRGLREGSTRRRQGRLHRGSGCRVRVLRVAARDKISGAGGAASWRACLAGRCELRIIWAPGRKRHIHFPVRELVPRLRVRASPVHFGYGWIPCPPDLAKITFVST